MLGSLRTAGAHQFLADDISPTDSDFPVIAGYRQVTDAHLLTLARRRAVRLVTFDTTLARLGGSRDVELLPT